MKGSAYISWEDLDDDEPREGAPSFSSPPENPKLVALLTERTRLERELNRVLGKEPPSEQDKREAARFPMVIHTPETRLAERAAAREALRARLATIRALERGQIKVRDEAKRRDLKRRGEREVLQQNRVVVLDKSKRQLLTVEATRRRRTQASIEARWNTKRHAAMLLRVAEYKEEVVLFDERSRASRKRAAGVSEARKQEDRDVQERLDQRGKRAMDGRAGHRG